jgi:hypothetical protein
VFEVATPAAVVTAVFEVVKLPEAPLPGGVKVTVTPETKFPYWSTSLTTSGAPKAVLTVVLWGLPETRLRVSPVVLAVIATVVEPHVVAPFIAVMAVDGEAVSSP